MKKNEENEKNKDQEQRIQSLVEELISEELEQFLFEEEEILIKEDSAMYKTWIEPFADILKTAKHGLESSIASITGNVRKVAIQFALSAIPFISAKEIARIGEEESLNIEKRLSELDSQYADVLKRNWDTLRTKDVAGLALLLNPSLTVGTHVALESPALALGLIEILSGGNPKIVALRKKAEELSKKVKAPSGPSGSDDSASGGSGGDYGWGGDFGGGY